MPHHGGEREPTQVGRERDGRGLRVRWNSQRHLSSRRDSAQIGVTQTLCRRSGMTGLGVRNRIPRSEGLVRLHATTIVLRSQHTLKRLRIGRRRLRHHPGVVGHARWHGRFHSQRKLTHHVARILSTVKRLGEQVRGEITLSDFVLHAWNHTSSTDNCTATQVCGRSLVLCAFELCTALSDKLGVLVGG